MNVSKSIVAVALLLTGYAQAENPGSADPIDWVRQAIEDRTIQGHIYVAHERERHFGQDGHQYYLLHTDPETRCYLPVQSGEGTSREGSEERPCRIRALSRVFLGNTLNLVEGPHSDSAVTFVPGYKLLYIQGFGSDTDTLVIDEDRSPINRIDAQVAIELATEREGLDLEVQDIEFAYHEKRWDPAVSFEEMMADLAENADRDLENCERDANAPTFWNSCDSCDSGGPGTQMCACSASFTSNECIASCYLGYYACCHCGDFSTDCECCGASGGGGGGGWPGGGPPLPPPPGDDDDPGDDEDQ